MDMIGGISPGRSTHLTVPKAIENTLSQMADPRAVAWAPKFATALVASTESKPRARTTVRAVCLDMWESHTHK